MDARLVAIVLSLRIRLDLSEAASSRLATRILQLERQRDRLRRRNEVRQPSLGQVWKGIADKSRCAVLARGNLLKDACAARSSYAVEAGRGDALRVKGATPPCHSIQVRVQVASTGGEKRTKGLAA